MRAKRSREPRRGNGPAKSRHTSIRGIETLTLKSTSRISYTLRSLLQEVNQKRRFLVCCNAPRVCCPGLAQRSPDALRQKVNLKGKDRLHLLQIRLSIPVTASCIWQPADENRRHLCVETKRKNGSRARKRRALRTPKGKEKSRVQTCERKKRRGSAGRPEVLTCKFKGGSTAKPLRFSMELWLSHVFRGLHPDASMDVRTASCVRSRNALSCTQRPCSDVKVGHLERL